MKKKILLGSILVLTLLLLMPSIPAIQIQSAKEVYKPDFQLLNDIISIDDVKYPNLFELVKFLILLRFEFALKLFEFSADIIYLNWQIHYPILFIWSLFLIYQCVARPIFWMYISNGLGWGWNFE